MALQVLLAAVSLVLALSANPNGMPATPALRGAANVSALDRATCACETPGQGTAGHNHYYCSNGYSAWCASNEVCYNTGTFPLGMWQLGCRVEDAVLSTFLKGEPVPSNGTVNAMDRATCACETPGVGTAGHNRYYCSNGYSAWCASNEVCYNAGTFPLGIWQLGCRVEDAVLSTFLKGEAVSSNGTVNAMDRATCTCETPDEGTAGHNRYYCSNGYSAWCASNEVCYNAGTFPLGIWQLGCRVEGAVLSTLEKGEPVPSNGTVNAMDRATCACETPDEGTAGHNRYYCSNGFSAWCASSEVCYNTGTFPLGIWQLGCRVEGAVLSTLMKGDAVPNNGTVNAMDRATCACETPGEGTAGHNRYYCSNGYSAWCASNEVCYNTGTFPLGIWQLGCRA